MEGNDKNRRIGGTKQNVFIIVINVSLIRVRVCFHITDHLNCLCSGLNLKRMENLLHMMLNGIKSMLVVVLVYLPAQQTIYTQVF